MELAQKRLDPKDERGSGWPTHHQQNSSDNRCVESYIPSHNITSHDNESIHQENDVSGTM